MLLTRKYAPTRRSDVVGNTESVNAIISYLNHMRSPRQQKSRKKILLLHGPSGVGKSSAIQAIIQSLNFEVLILDSPMEFDPTRLFDFQKDTPSNLLSYLEGENVPPKIGKIVTIPNIDYFSRKELTQLLKTIKKVNIPLILTATNISNSKWHPLRKLCEIREFKLLQSKEIFQVLKTISQQEQVVVPTEILEEIALRSRGNLRWAITHLHSLIIGKKELNQTDLDIISENEEPITIRELLEIIFVEGDGERAFKKSMQLKNGDYHKLLLLISDFTTALVSNQEQRNVLQTILIKADQSLTRGQRNRYWSQLKYFYLFITDILAEMATSVKELPPIPKWQLDVPRYWIILSRGRQTLQLATKISKKCQISKNMARKEILPFLIVIFSSNVEMAAKLAIWLDLITIIETKSSRKIVWNEDELRYLTNEKNMRTTIKRKVKEIIDHNFMA